MQKKQIENVGTVLYQFLRQEGLETPYNEYRLVQAWPEVVGKAIAAKTTECYIRSRVLYVRILSSVIRNELRLNRRALVQRMNTHVAAQVIDDIHFL